jgi:hypothetical protein
MRVLYNESYAKPMTSGQLVFGSAGPPGAYPDYIRLPLDAVTMRVV